VAPEQHSREAFGQRQLADAHADLVVKDRPFRGMIEFKFPKMRVRIEAAKITPQTLHPAARMPRWHRPRAAVPSSKPLLTIANAKIF
jgi:hypothetical protein